MKVFLSSRYSRRVEMTTVADELAKAGHTVVSRWLATEWSNDGEGSSAAPPEYREKYAVIDAEDVRACDTFVAFTEPPNAGGRGGRHVEFGMAVALGKRLIVVGHYENIFHHLPGIAFFRDAGCLLGALALEN